MKWAAPRAADVMHVALEHSRRRALFAIFTTVLVLLYAYYTARQYLAYHAAEQKSLAGLKTAIRLEPSNAEYHHILGRHGLLIEQAPTIAVDNFRAAAALNPREPRYWVDLASAYLVAGDSERARWAIDRAVRLDTTTPELAWDATNLYLAIGSERDALRQIRVFLDGDAGDGGPGLNLCWRITHDVNLLMDEALPPRPDRYIGLLYLVMQDDAAAAGQVWKRLLQLHQPFPLRHAFPYVQNLLDHHESGKAAQVWRDLVSVDQSFASYIPTDNLIVNGSFSEQLLNAGFDWRYRTVPHVSLTLDTAEFHDGFRSLAVEFDGGGVADVGIAQYIPIEPDTKYQFSGYYKTMDLAAAGGAFVSIIDAYTGTEFTSAKLSPGSGWQNVRASFRTSGSTHLALLRLLRIPAGSAIRGRIWIDQFRLSQE